MNPYIPIVVSLIAAAGTAFAAWLTVRVGRKKVKTDAVETLDAAYRIQVRSGVHCAPRLHHELGTAEGGGTVRLSPGPFTTAAEIDRTIAAVAETASAGPGAY